MKQHDMPVPASGRQMNLVFETRKLDGLGEEQRNQAVFLLAQILLQAAGLVVEELSDDEH